MLRSTVRHLEDENARLREIIARLTHKEFGSGSERACKLDLVEDEPPATDIPATGAAEGAAEKPSAPRKRTRLGVPPVKPFPIPYLSTRLPV